MTTTQIHRELALLTVLRTEPATINLHGPTGVSERQGFWQVDHFENGARWTCLCGRSEPIDLTLREHSNARLPLTGEPACEVCRAEYAAARCKRERLAAWIEQHRRTLCSHKHYELDQVLSEGKTSDRDRMSRIRRFVYERFWKESVDTNSCVHLKCNNERCINPHHLCLTKNPASKLPEKALIEAKTLASRGHKTSLIQSFLLENHSIQLSLRSVQRIVRETKKLRSLNT